LCFSGQAGTLLSGARTIEYIAISGGDDPKTKLGRFTRSAVVIINIRGGLWGAKSETGQRGRF